MKFLTIDPSLSGFAVSLFELIPTVSPPALVRVDGFVLETKAAEFLGPIARIDYLRDQVEVLRKKHGIEAVAMEGYSFGSTNGREAAGELGGLIKWTLWLAGVTIWIVPPTTLKKFITGKGTARKEMMIKEVFKRWGYEAADNNDCDAYALGRFLAAYFQRAELSKEVQKVLAGAEILLGNGVAHAPSP